MKREKRPAMSFLAPWLLFSTLISLAGCGIPSSALQSSMDQFRSYKSVNNNAYYSPDINDLWATEDSACFLPVKVNGTLMRGTVSKSALYRRMQQLPGGFFYVGLKDTDHFEKKKKETWCWASCVQHLMLFAGHHPHSATANVFNASGVISQEELVYKLHNLPLSQRKADAPELADAASAWDIANIMGLYRVSVVSGGGSASILQSLAAGFPVILCFHPQDSDTGHAVIVTGAYFKFAKQDFLSSLVHSSPYVFYKLEILDPDTGKPGLEDAAALEGSISGVVAFMFPQCDFPAPRIIR